MQMFKKNYRNRRISNDTFKHFHSRILQKTQNFLINKIFSKLSKNANQQPSHQSPRTTYQEPPTIPTNGQTKIPNHQHAYLFKTIHTHLKKNTRDCSNH